MTNKQEVSSGVLLKSIHVDEGVSDEQYFSPYYPTPSHTVSLGDSILIVSGTIKNKHKENTWIDMWAEGYDETGEQVSWTLDDAHLWLHILMNLETEETGEFVIHLNYPEDVSSIRIYANNYPVPPPQTIKNRSRIQAMSLLFQVLKTSIVRAYTTAMKALRNGIVVLAWIGIVLIIIGTCYMIGKIISDITYSPDHPRTLSTGLNTLIVAMYITGIILSTFAGIESRPKYYWPALAILGIISCILPVIEEITEYYVFGHEISYHFIIKLPPGIILIAVGLVIRRLRIKDNTKESIRVPQSN